jgi:hypothetical protein
MEKARSIKFFRESSCLRWQRRTFFLVPAIYLVFLLGPGCDIKPTIDDIRIDTVNVLNDAIDSLANESANWQQVLQDSMNKLTKDAQSTVRNEVSVVLSRSIAATGVEFRCNVDFIGDRVRQALIRIKAKLLNQPVPPVEPALCHVVPIAVDREAVPRSVQQLEFYGYDFDIVSHLKVFLERAIGNRLDVTNNLDRPTHYSMTISFGAGGVQLDDQSRRFVVEWQGKPISTIAVIQPETPVCETKVITVPSATVTFTPPKVGRGDADFDGNGPIVTTRVSLITTPQTVQATIFMQARETKSDWTEASGSETFSLYTADPGWKIDGVHGEQFHTHSYIDSNHSTDSFDRGSGGLVKRFEYVGDTDGDEAGTRTQVKVIFNQLKIEVTKTENCISPRTVQSLLQQKRMLHRDLITERSLLRLEPGIRRLIVPQ